MTVIKANLMKRFIALAIDNVLCLALSLLPLMGSLLAAAYMLLRDGVDWNFMHYRSLGKTWLRLKIDTLDGEAPISGFVTSIRRNWILALPSLLSTLPLIGIYIALPAGLIVWALEGFRVLTDENGRRFGDLWAKTVVVEET